MQRKNVADIGVAGVFAADARRMSQDITRLLDAASDGDGEALDAALRLLYDALHRLAREQLRQDRNERTLSATALVNEVYLKFERQNKLDIRGRTHFLAMSATAMRQVLVDHARQRKAQKRGGNGVCITLDETTAIDPGRAEDLLDLHRALEKLAELDATEARIVEMRFFAGLTEVEIARELGVSERTVRGQWSHAKAWLRRELS